MHKLSFAVSLAALPLCLAASDPAGHALRPQLVQTLIRADGEGGRGGHPGTGGGTPGGMVVNTTIGAIGMVADVPSQTWFELDPYVNNTNPVYRFAKLYPGETTYHVQVNNAPVGATVELYNNMSEGRPQRVPIVNGSAWIGSSPVAFRRGYDFSYFTAWPMASAVADRNPQHVFIVRNSSGNVIASANSPYPYEVGLNYGAATWSTNSLSNPDTYFQVAVNTDLASCPSALFDEWLVECHTSNPYVGPYGGDPPAPAKIYPLARVIGPVTAGSPYCTWISLRVQENLSYPYYVVRTNQPDSPRLLF